MARDGNGMTHTRGGTRIRNLLLRREAPYPLGHTSCDKSCLWAASQLMASRDGRAERGTRRGRAGWHASVAGRRRAEQGKAKSHELWQCLLLVMTCSGPAALRSFAKHPALRAECAQLDWRKANNHRGARTHDHKVKGLALYRLSSAGCCMIDPHKTCSKQ